MRRKPGEVAPVRGFLARFFALAEVSALSLDLHLARACGELCAIGGTADVIDALVVLVAREHRDPILTNDVEDLRRLDPTARLERIGAGRCER